MGVNMQYVMNNSLDLRFQNVKFVKMDNGIYPFTILGLATKKYSHGLYYFAFHFDFTLKVVQKGSGTPPLRPFPMPTGEFEWILGLARTYRTLCARHCILPWKTSELRH